jgi:signal recognition particle subunit SEC65
MNQLKETNTTDFEKLGFLKSHLPKEHLRVYKENATDGNKVSYHYFDFVPFCHAYAEHLLVNGSYDVYDSFINKFNNLVENDAVHKLTKNIQDSYASQLGGLPLLSANYNKALIKDKRPGVEGRSFINESDLEKIVYEELKNAFDNEIDIKRQRKHGYGKSDITIGNKVTIELKKSKAKRMDVYQTFEYSFDEKLEDVCLLASEFDQKTLSIANKLGVSCYTYSFVYEESNKGYPIGFVIDKTNKTKNNLFDEYLEAMDECFWISFYDPTFRFNESYKYNLKKVREINDLTNKLHEGAKNRILTDLEKQGYDTSSQNLEQILQKIKKEQEAI